MENLTHLMAGLLMSRAGLNRLAPRATLGLLLATNAPDLDILAAGWGSLAYLRHHRGLTHGVVGVPLLAALVALVMWLTRPRRPSPSLPFPWWRAYLVALAGVASHPLMDLTNVYGVRPWEPFASTWYSWDIEPLVDVWLTAGLLACLAGPALGRLISGEIGARPGTGRAGAVAGLVFLAAWAGGRALLHHRAVAMLEAHLYGAIPAGTVDAEGRQPSLGEPPRRVAGFPNPINPFRWRGLVETEGFYQILEVDALGSVDPTRGSIYYKPEPSPALEAALRAPSAVRFAAFARYPHVAVEPRDDGFRVVISDFRFRGERPRAFVCAITLARDWRVVREDFSF